MKKAIILTYSGFQDHEVIYPYHSLKENNFEVNSIHHQGIDKLGDDLIISARSEDDVIEGIEITNGWDAIGIQWHHEYLDDEPTSKIYDWLINS